jgi:signal peptidase I
MKPRKSCFSFLLSLLLPGLGQIYNGRFLKGLLLYLLYFASLVGLLLSPLSLLTAGLIIFSLRILICTEAAFEASRGVKLHLYKSYHRWYIYITIFCLGAIGGRYIRKRLVSEIEVAGNSMEPTLLAGDLTVANRILYRFRAPRKGDVVILENPLHPGHLLVKRVVATGGEEVVIQEGTITVDDQDILSPPQVRPMHPHGSEDATAKPTGSVPPSKGTNEQEKVGKLRKQSWKIPEGYLFVLSDNLRRAPDSRVFGPVPAAAVKANLLKIFWSWDRENERVRWHRIGKNLTSQLFDHKISQD